MHLTTHVHLFSNLSFKMALHARGFVLPWYLPWYLPLFCSADGAPLILSVFSASFGRISHSPSLPSKKRPCFHTKKSLPHHLSVVNQRSNSKFRVSVHWIRLHPFRRYVFLDCCTGIGLRSPLGRPKDRSKSRKPEESKDIRSTCRVQGMWRRGIISIGGTRHAPSE
jgi:hypothetical protein